MSERRIAIGPVLFTSVSIRENRSKVAPALAICRDTTDPRFPCPARNPQLRCAQLILHLDPPIDNPPTDPDLLASSIRPRTGNIMTPPRQPD